MVCCNLIIGWAKACKGQPTSCKISSKVVRAAIMYPAITSEDHSFDSKWWHIRTMATVTINTDGLRHQRNHPGGGPDGQLLRQS